MINCGLTSVTFRQLSPPEIVKLVAKSPLTYIEWGGDIHVPHGDIKQAEQIYQITIENGLQVSSYGSYFFAGDSESAGLSFQHVLDTAIALKAPVIRIWAGKKGSKDADKSHRTRVVEDSLRIADTAASANIQLAYEYHAGTLTDTIDSAQDLLAKTDHPNIGIYWQPQLEVTVDQNISELKRILSKLIYVHVFHWTGTIKNINRHTFSEGRNCWTKYFDIIKSSNKKNIALIEFVRGDNPSQFLNDADFLIDLIK